MQRQIVYDMRWLMNAKKHSVKHEMTYACKKKKFV